MASRCSSISCCTGAGAASAPRWARLLHVRAAVAPAPSPLACSTSGHGALPQLRWMHSYSRQSSSCCAPGSQQQRRRRALQRLGHLPSSRSWRRAPPRPRAELRAAEPAWAAGEHRSHTQSLYRVTEEPITSFGYATGFEDKYELLEEVRPASTTTPQWLQPSRSQPCPNLSNAIKHPHHPCGMDTPPPRPQLARGTYGVVYAGRDRATGERCGPRTPPPLPPLALR